MRITSCGGSHIACSGPARRSTTLSCSAGIQGIGKDTLLEPVKRAVGPWNFVEVSPQHMLGRFNGFVKSVILRVSEARDLGDVDRYAFYDHMKIYTAARPTCCGATRRTCASTPSSTSAASSSPPTTRRTASICPPMTAATTSRGPTSRRRTSPPTTGIDSVALVRGGRSATSPPILHELDLSDFDPKAPPPKTPAFWDIVDANRAPEDAELADVLDKLGNPDADHARTVIAHASPPAIS